MLALFNLPKLSPTARSTLLHFGYIFLGAFATQLLAGISGKASISTLFAGVDSAAFAGVIALLRAAATINTLEQLAVTLRLPAIPAWLKSKLYVVAVAVVGTFLTLFGAGLVTGLAHPAGVSSFPAIANAITSAIAAGVSGVVTYLLSLVRQPKVTTLGFVRAPKAT